MIIKVTYKATHYYGPSECEQIEYPLYINVNRIERFYSQQDTIVESDKGYKKALKDRYNGTVITFVGNHDSIIVKEGAKEILRLIQEAGGKNAV